MPLAIPHKSLLVVHQGALGDLIATFPVLRALGAVFEPLDGVLRNTFGVLAQHLGLIRQHEPLEAARFATLYSPPLDPAVEKLLGNFHRILLFSLSETLEASVRTANRRVFRIAPWPAAHERIEVTRFLAKQLTESGLFDEEEQIDFVAALTGGKPPAPVINRRRIILAPGAGSPKKRWPLSHFLSLADSLSRRNYRPEILLGPAETDIEPFLSQSGGGRPPQIRPKTLLALVECLSDAGGFIGNDSAAGHLAAFIGLPTVAIFGPSDPLRWKPWGPCVRVVQSKFDCSPCFDDRRSACEFPGSCMERIEPAQVLQAFCQLRPEWL
ncbi:MAG TPA: glycosyltransferase family 9 protein [Desulfobacterales bacterium]